MIEAVTKRVAGLDVHKMVVVGTVLLEQEDGSLQHETKQFGTFKRERRKLCQWLKDHDIELVVMESTGIFWKSIYSTLQRAQIHAYVVNARHVKNVPGRKTDVSDSHWLAALARLGLLRPSFIPPEDLNQLRELARQRMKLKGMLSAEKNRLSKILDSAGIRLSGVVTDIGGKSAQEIIDGLINGVPIDELLNCIRGRLKSKTEQLKDCLDEELTPKQIFVLKEIRDHIKYLNSAIQRFDEALFAAMSPYKKQWEILQTLPGVDKVSAAILIVEIGTYMEQFGSADRLCSWAGMCPGNNESAGKRKSGRTRKGNIFLRTILCEIANAAIKTRSQFKGKYESLVIRRGHKRAIIAIGHKILRIIFTLLKRNQPYHDPNINYEKIMVDRNAPRWLKALDKYGYLPQAA